jgi:hypothetical protein
LLRGPQSACLPQRHSPGATIRKAYLGRSARGHDAIKEVPNSADSVCLLLKLSGHRHPDGEARVYSYFLLQSGCVRAQLLWHCRLVSRHLSGGRWPRGGLAHRQFRGDSDRDRARRCGSSRLTCSCADLRRDFHPMPSFLARRGSRADLSVWLQRRRARSRKPTRVSSRPPQRVRGPCALQQRPSPIESRRAGPGGRI